MIKAAGYVVTQALAYVFSHAHGIRKMLDTQHWTVHALVAGLVLSALMLIGGPLTEFTGNTLIIPLFEQAAQLGLLGLLWIIAFKVLAISWSKAAGYRGGVIFPMVFIAIALIAIVRLYVPDFSFIYGLIAVLVGAFIANRRTHILA